MFLLGAEAVLRNGTVLPAFLTPGRTAGDIGTMQPHVWVDSVMFGFWGGMIGVPEEARREFLQRLGLPAADVFPIRVAASHLLADAVVEATIDGWYPRRADVRNRWS
jgi:hypothetical protein